MKKINLLFFLLLLVVAAQAQKHEPVNTKKDQRQVDGYTIRLVPAQEGTYGYEVTQSGKRLIYQTQNPFTTSPRGLANKEDAYKVAQFQVKQLEAKAGTTDRHTAASANNKKLSTRLPQQQSSSETLYNQHLSPKVAEQLKISITQ